MNKLLVFAVLLTCSAPAQAYSLLTHEQLIDLTWKQSIVPLLLSRYPGLTALQLEEARAYAYGGCVIQDIGYYPFGDAFFSNLTHYVRTGDFVINLFRNSRNANELAFAVGALSHYIGDNIGHHEAVNLAVPVEFPKLGKKYGHRSATQKVSGSMSKRSSPSTSTKSLITILRPSIICGKLDSRSLRGSFRRLFTKLTGLEKTSLGITRGGKSMFARTGSRFAALFPASHSRLRSYIATMSRPTRSIQSGRNSIGRSVSSPARTNGTLSAASQESKRILLQDCCLSCPRSVP